MTGAGSNEVLSIKPQADINIFTVASGLLYEVGSRDVFSGFRAEGLSAIRLDHDSECPPEYQQHGEVLVYRKFLIPVIPCECTLSAVILATGT